MDALQKLAEIAWSLLDPIARDEVVADQFLNGLDSYELRIQVAATRIWRIEDLMRVARSFEAVENQEAGHGTPAPGIKPNPVLRRRGTRNRNGLDRRPTLSPAGTRVETEQRPEEASTHPGAPACEKRRAGNVSRSPEGTFQEQRSREGRRTEPGTLAVYR